MKEKYYEKGEVRVGRTIIVAGAREAALVPMMEEFTKIYPDLALSSLTKFVVGGGTEIHLGIQGKPENVKTGYGYLVERLEDMGLRWVEKDEQGVDQ